MKRDMDLVRRILLYVEAGEYHASDRFEMPDEDLSLVGHHVILMKKAGLIEANVIEQVDPPFVRVFGLTWEGHNLMERLRNETVWKHVVATVKERGGAMTVDILVSLAKLYAKQHMGLEA